LRLDYKKVKKKMQSNQQQTDDLPPLHSIDELDHETFLTASQFTAQRICDVESPHFFACLHSLLDKQYYNCVTQQNIDVISLLTPNNVNLDRNTLQKLHTCYQRDAQRYDRVGLDYDTNWKQYMNELNDTYRERAVSAIQEQRCINVQSDSVPVIKEKVTRASNSVCTLPNIAPTTANVLTRATEMTKFSRCMTSEVCARELLECMKTGSDIDRCCAERSVMICSKFIRYAFTDYE
jgi:hypothetical protein